MKWSISLLLAVCVLAGGLTRADGVDAKAHAAAVERAVATISEPEARGMVRLLTDPHVAGRGTGSEGFLFAARMMAVRLEELGDEPFYGDSYLQSFNLLGGLQSMNVLGFLPGETRETVVLSAHLDHLGVEYADFDLDPRKLSGYYPGADDNASGVTAVFQVAKAFARIQREEGRLRRSVLVAFWGAEEMGMRGSEALAKRFQQTPSLRVGPADLVFVMNMDMVGRRYEGDDEAPGGRKTVLVIGSPRTRTIEQFAHRNPILARVLTESAQSDPALFLNFDELRQNLRAKNVFEEPKAVWWRFWGVYGRSDSYTFAKMRPGLATLFFCGPEHPDYHEKSDTWEKLDYDRLVRISRLAFRVAFAIAESAVTPICDCKEE